MRRSLLAVPLFIAALVAGRPVSAALVDSCCACLTGEKATTSQAPAPRPALFCDFLTAREIPRATSECNDAGGLLTCPGVAMANQTCTEFLLAEAAVVCPDPAPAPTASSWGLTALTLALVGFGAAAMRRRLS